MGNNPITPARRREATGTEIETKRLDTLREMVARSEITYAQHARYVEQVLRGENPVSEDGLPIMADPEIAAFEGLYPDAYSIPYDERGSIPVVMVVKR